MKDPFYFQYPRKEKRGRKKQTDSGSHQDIQSDRVIADLVVCLVRFQRQQVDQVFWLKRLAQQQIPAQSLKQLISERKINRSMFDSKKEKKRGGEHTARRAGRVSRLGAKRSVMSWTLCSIDEPCWPVDFNVLWNKSRNRSCTLIKSNRSSNPFFFWRTAED